MIYRPIKNDDSIKDIFHLIYSGDPVIYKDLFGDFESGLKVYEKIWNNAESIFFRDYYRVAVNEEGRIIAICTFYNKYLRWNPDILRSAFIMANVKIPESFYSASQYFLKTYNYSHLPVSACNVCVHEDYRGQGVGSFIIKELLNEVGNVDIQLTVLKDNIPAIKLYEKFGFKIIEEFNDYGGYQQDDVISYQMYRMVS